MSHRSDSSKFVSPDLEAKNVDEIKYEADIQDGNAKNQIEYQVHEAAIPRYSSQSAVVTTNQDMANMPNMARAQRNHEPVPKAISSFSEHA